MHSFEDKLDLRSLAPEPSHLPITKNSVESYSMHKPSDREQAGASSDLVPEEVVTLCR